MTRAHRNLYCFIFFGAAAWFLFSAAIHRFEYRGTLETAAATVQDVSTRKCRIDDGCGRTGKQYMVVYALSFTSADGQTITPIKAITGNTAPHNVKPGDLVEMTYRPQTPHKNYISKIAGEVKTPYSGDRFLSFVLILIGIGSSIYLWHFLMGDD